MSPQSSGHTRPFWADVYSHGSIGKTHLSLEHPLKPLTGCPAFENSHRERLVIRKPKPSGFLGRQGISKWVAQQLASAQGEMVTKPLALRATASKPGISGELSTAMEARV